MTHPHSVKVIVKGPFGKLDPDIQDYLRDRLTSVVSTRGFQRETQREITVKDADQAFMVDVSISDRYADMGSAQMAESLCGDVVATVERVIGPGTCTLERQFARH